MVKQKQKRTKTYFNGTMRGSRRYSLIHSGKLRVAIVVELPAGCAAVFTAVVVVIVAVEEAAAAESSITAVLLVFFFFFFEFLLPF